MHPLVRLARKTIAMHIQEGRTPEPSDDLPVEEPRRAGVFVSIHSHGRLRGCIGTLEPTQDSLAEEVIANAVSAATRDPRFPPITAQELSGLEIKVDVLSEPEEVQSVDTLDPKRYGVIVQSKLSPWKRGVLLPDLEGVDTVQDQVSIARRKAWIAPEEPVRLYRFQVHRYS